MSVNNVTGDPSVFTSTGLAVVGSIGATYITGTFTSQSDSQILLKRIEAIEERLAILEPNQELQEKYPSLQEAYDAYKIIEKLVKSGEK